MNKIYVGYKAQVDRINEIIELMVVEEKAEREAIKGDKDLAWFVENNIKLGSERLDKIKLVIKTAQEKKAELICDLVKYTQYQTPEEVKDLIMNFKWSDIKSTLELAYGKLSTRKAFFEAVDKRARKENPTWNF